MSRRCLTDWIYNYFGRPAPPSVFDRFFLVTSLAQLGRFTEAVQWEAEMIRLAEPTHHHFTIGLAHQGGSMLHLVKGDWAKAHLLCERSIAVLRAANVVLVLPRVYRRPPPGSWRSLARPARR